MIRGTAIAALASTEALVNRALQFSEQRLGPAWPEHAVWVREHAEASAAQWQIDKIVRGMR